MSGFPEWRGFDFRGNGTRVKLKLYHFNWGARVWCDSPGNGMKLFVNWSNWKERKDVFLIGKRR